MIIKDQVYNSRIPKDYIEASHMRAVLSTNIILYLEDMEVVDYILNLKCLMIILSSYNNNFYLKSLTGSNNT